MGVIKNGVSNIQAPQGGSLAIYIDNISNEIMLKDAKGNIELLSNFIKQTKNYINEFQFYLIDEDNSIKPMNGNNSLIGKNNVILSGEYNVNRGNFSIINGGNSNTTATEYTIINGGKGNTVDANFGIINGGSNNSVDGDFSSILSGQNNKIKKHKNSHIIGSNILANRNDTTFIENLSITKIPTSNKGLPKNSVWNNNGVLSIV